MRELLLLGTFCVTAWSQNIEWYRQFNHPNGVSSLGYGVPASGGSIYVASLTSGPVLWKYDTSGNQVWERDLATNGSGDGFAVAADATGAYIVGDATALPGQPQIFNDVAFIRKYDPSGNEVWTRLFAVQEVSAATQALGGALDSKGVYMAGFTRGTLPGKKSSGSEDIFVRKYDLRGDEVWTRQLGPGRATSIAVNSTGLYVTGSGGCTTSGQTGSEFPRKYDASGNVVTRQFGGFLEDFARGVAVDGTGVYVAGSAQTKHPGQTKIDLNYDGFVRKFENTTPTETSCGPNNSGPPAWIGPTPW